MKKIILILLITLPFFCKSQSNINDGTSKQYFENGIPTVNKDWSPEEYATAMNKIMELYDNKTIPLPSNNKGKEVFEKIANYENYWFFQSEEFTNKDKMFFCLDIMKPISQYYLKYYQSGTKNNGVLNNGTEILTIQKTLIKIMDKMLELTDDFVAKNPNLTEIQKEGLKKIKFGLNSFISGTIMILNNEYTNYLENDICDLSNVFFNFYKKNRNTIDEVSKNEFDKECANLNKNHKLDCIKKSALME